MNIGSINYGMAASYGAYQQKLTQETKNKLEEYGIARATPEDLRGELPDNAKEIANMLISMGLAKRYADGVTLIGWEV